MDRESTANLLCVTADASVGPHSRQCSRLRWTPARRPAPASLTSSVPATPSLQASLSSLPAVAFLHASQSSLLAVTRFQASLSSLPAVLLSEASLSSLLAVLAPQASRGSSQVCEAQYEQSGWR